MKLTIVPKPPPVITKLVDACPSACCTTQISKPSHGVKLTLACVSVGPDRIGPFAFDAATISRRQAHAIARILQDSEPHQN